MKKEDYFKLFRETGKIEYYLEYCKQREVDNSDKKNRGNSSK